jgi:hypothetical protein
VANEDIRSPPDKADSSKEDSEHVTDQIFEDFLVCHVLLKYDCLTPWMVIPTVLRRLNTHPMLLSGRPQPQIFNDENTHPGASTFNWQPGSVRHSVGGKMSMDIEKDDAAHCPSAFLRAPNASDSAFQDDDGDTTSNR